MGKSTHFIASCLIISGNHKETIKDKERHISFKSPTIISKKFKKQRTPFTDDQIEKLEKSVVEEIDETYLLIMQKNKI
ncbi:hypothetical protein M902_1249 [Bacteriovorax sp. BAL6_X]|nr:hypothetical protein M902_1249 [Bacteriovorax sp. BAL6_X]